MTARILITITLLATIISGRASAQDCADWSATMPPPIQYPDVDASALLAIDGLLLAAVGNTLEVLDPSSPDLSVIGTCPLPVANCNRIRGVGGAAYAVFRNDGLWRIDLTNPAQPTCELVYGSESPLSDLVGVPGGVVVAIEGGECLVFAELTGDPDVALAQFDLGSSISAMGASGATVCIVGRAGLTTADLSDLTSPQVGGSAYCEPDAPYPGMIECYEVVTIGDRAYASLNFFWQTPGINQSFLQSFDITDPLNPVPDICRPVPSQYVTVVTGEAKIFLRSSYSIAILSPDDLEVMAAAMVPETPTQIAILGDEVFATSYHHGLARLDFSVPVTVAPVATNAYGYNPAGCGRFGHRTHERRDQFGWGEHTTEIYDQQDPTAPVLIYESEMDVSEFDEYDTRLALQNEGWAIVRGFLRHSSDWGGDYVTTSYEAVDAAGQSYGLGSAWVCWATLAEDQLWLAGDFPYEPDYLQAFDLSGDMPISHARLEVDEAGQPVLVGDLLLIIRGSQIDVYDVTDPDAPVAIAEFDPDLAFQWETRPPVVADRIIYARTTTGLAILEVIDDLEAPILLRGTVDIGTAPGELALQDGILATNIHDAWHLIDVANPDQPLILAAVPGVGLGGLVLSDDHLYVGTRGSVYLYDVADPAAPVWVGQAEAVAYSQGSVCRFADLLLDGHRVFPLDCSDIVAIDPDDDDPGPIAIPAAVHLRQPTPNPFNPRTTITFDLARRIHATLTIHDLRGRAVTTLADAPFEAGSHTLSWNGTDTQGRPLPSGTYLVRLTTESAARTTKAVLLR